MSTIDLAFIALAGWLCGNIECGELFLIKLTHNKVDIKMDNFLRINILINNYKYHDALARFIPNKAFNHDESIILIEIAPNKQNNLDGVPINSVVDVTDLSSSNKFSGKYEIVAKDPQYYHFKQIG